MVAMGNSRYSNNALFTQLGLVTAVAAVLIGGFAVTPSYGQASTFTSTASVPIGGRNAAGTGPYCPAGTTYNDATGRCEGPTHCPAGFSPDATGTCVAP